MKIAENKYGYVEKYDTNELHYHGWVLPETFLDELITNGNVTVDIIDMIKKEFNLGEVYQECSECHMKTLEVTAHCATCINCGYSLCWI
jgi:hypothetical protein